MGREFVTKQGETARRVAPMVTVEDGRKVLRVGGVIQSVAVDERYTADVWDAMLPQRQPASALILGLGGGAIAQLMTRRWGPLPIVGVEMDPAVVWLARHEFGLDELAHLSIVTADAFDWVARCEQRFDAIAVDLYTAGKMAHGVLGASFLRDVRRLLTLRGEAAFNLWRSAYLSDQLRRVERVFSVMSIVEADDNLIVHAAPRHD